MQTGQIRCTRRVFRAQSNIYDVRLLAVNYFGRKTPLQDVRLDSKDAFVTFNLDPTKQAHKVIFSRMSNKLPYSTLKFKKATVKSVPTQKHLRLYLDEKLKSNHYLNEKNCKTSKEKLVF